VTGPVAIVTGAARGIGRAIAGALAARGFAVAACDINPAAAAAGVHPFAFDLARLDSHRRMVERIAGRFGRIDCVVHNAGVGARARGDLLDLSAGNFDSLMRVNLRGTIFFSQATARWMRAHPPRHDQSRSPPAPRCQIFITSVSATMVSPERADYCVSKSGLSMWAKALALRLAGDAIAVFEVRPGIIRTAMTEAAADVHAARIAAGRVPAGRWGEPEDVARIVAQLAGADFAFATGSVIHADGALSVARL